MHKKQLFFTIIFTITFFLLNACEDKDEHREDIAKIAGNKSDTIVSIKSVSPQKYIEQKQKIYIEFSQQMDKNSFSALSVTLKDKEYKSEVEIEFSSVKNKLTIIPMQTLQKDKTYLLHINQSVKDLAGNPLKTSYSTEFLCVVPPS